MIAGGGRNKPLGAARAVWMERKRRMEEISMRTPKKTWKNVLYTCVLLAAICLLFQWYLPLTRAYKSTTI